MKPEKRYWLCFIYGWGALILGYLGFGQLHRLIFVELFGFSAGEFKRFFIPYIYIPVQSQRQLYVLLGIYTLMTIGILFCIPWSIKLFNMARIYFRRAKELTLSKDIPLKIPYVLYLHRFNYQPATAKIKKISFLKEEEIYVHSLSAIDKTLETVVIGASSNQAPPLGGCRIQVSDEEWQNTVIQLSKDAMLTALRITEPKDLDWEIEYTLKNIVDLEKLIFLIPDIENLNFSFFANLEDTIRECRPNDVKISSCYYNKQGWGSVSSIVYFEKQENGSDNAPTYIMKQSMVPRRTIWNRFGDISSAFQKALFPVYKQFGKLTFRKKLSNAFFTYNFYILIPILVICLLLFNIALNQHQLHTSANLVSSADYTQAIHEVEQKYPVFANKLLNEVHSGQKDYMYHIAQFGAVHLSDEHLIEFVALEMEVDKVRIVNHYPIDRALSVIPKDDAIKYNNYMLKSALMHLKIEKPEYTSIDTEEEFQNKLSELRSSFTEEEFNAINQLLSPENPYSVANYFSYMELISDLPVKSKASLIRGLYILKIRNL